MLKGRRIIFVLFNLDLGGAERQALILAKYLAQHEQAAVEVWGFNRAGPVVQLCEEAGLPWRVVPYPFKSGSLARLAALVRLAFVFRRARPDVLLPYTFVPNIVCGLIWRWTGARACVWNQRDEGVAPFASAWERRAVQRTPLFIANSAAGARFLTEKLGVDAAKVTVIANGIEESEPEDDRETWRARLGVDDRCFVACMVANLHDNKDHKTLLRAWRRVVDELNGAAVLVLAGRHYGAYESLVALAEELKIQDKVRFLGPVSDVAGLLSAADLGVFSSRSEGCPNSVLESMAAGLAVAGTDVEGIRTVVGAEGAPFLTAPGDDGALAAAVIRLANDSDLRVTIGAQNRSRVREKYDAARMCEETVAVLVKELSWS
ncbi:MAG TPA: glycosyltransferase [Pyrinomonadaceae bacterium]|nr:glycosyltransferase [Pyrinomonadaceae bacterium]